MSNLLNRLKSLEVLSSTGCQSPTYRELMENGVTDPAFPLTPEETRRRLALCRGCKHHGHKADGQSPYCKLHKCAGNKNGRFLFLSCRDNRWKANEGEEIKSPVSKGIMLLHHVKGYRDPDTKIISEAFISNGWKIMEHHLDSRKPLWGLPKIIDAMKEAPRIVMRWEEHAVQFANKEWLGACRWCHEHNILPMQVDWGYFNHYKTYLMDVYDIKGQPSILQKFDSMSETIEWQQAPKEFQDYKKYMEGEWRVAGELGPVPGTKPGYVLIYQQFSHYLSTLKTKSYEDWCLKAQQAVEKAGLKCVWKLSKIRPTKLPTDAIGFDETMGISHLNTRLLKFCAHAVVITSTVSHEAALRNIPVVATGRGWHSGLGVFAEAKDWDDIAKTPVVDLAARAKWTNFWLQYSAPKRLANDLFNKTINRSALYGVGLGMGNMIMAIPALKAMAQTLRQPVDVGSRVGIRSGYIELLKNQPFVKNLFSKLNKIDTSFYNIITSAAFGRHLPDVKSPKGRVIKPGVEGLFPHEALRNNMPCRIMGFKGILPSAHIRVGLPKRKLPTAFVVVGMDCTDGENWSKRRWPHWERFAHIWNERHTGMPLVFLGVKDTPWAGAAGINLIGKTTPREAQEILQQAEALVSIDNGMSHLAASVRTPSVVLYGCTTSLSYGPWQSSVTALAADVPCRPCIFFRSWGQCKDIKCINNILPERVADVLSRVLERHGEPIVGETAHEQAMARFNISQRIKIPPAQRLHEMTALWEMLVDLRPQTVVDIGTLRGGWLYVIAPTCRYPAHLIGIDIAFRKAKERTAYELKKEGHSIDWIEGNSNDPKTVERLKELLAGTPIDVLQIDGDHSEKAVLKDWEMYSPFVRPGGLILLHDADNPTEEVPRALAIIKKTKRKEIKHIRLFVDPNGTPPLGIAVLEKA